MPVGGDSKCPGHLESPPLALRIPPVVVIALRDNDWLLRTRCYCLNWLDTETEGST